MPKFFFDIVDGAHTVIDQSGVDLSNADQAREEATRTLTEIAGQELPGDGPTRNFKIIVSDANHEILFEVQLAFSTIEGIDHPGDSGGA